MECKVKGQADKKETGQPVQAMLMAGAMQPERVNFFGAGPGTSGFKPMTEPVARTVKNK